MARAKHVRQLERIILMAGFLVFFIDAIRSARRGPIAPDNPWDAPTLEWSTASPPPSYNFARMPVVAGPIRYGSSLRSLPLPAGYAPTVANW